jgi:Tfp pilus assembly protein PilZ
VGRSRNTGGRVFSGTRGMFLVTERPSPVGTALRFRLIGDSGQTVEVEGAVAWVRRPGTGARPPGMGIEFSNLDETKREAVTFLVDKALTEL